MDDVVFVVAEQDNDAIRLLIYGPWGQVEIISDVRFEEDTIYSKGLHINGPGVGMLGLAGLNVICRKVLEETGASQIVIEGGVRASGPNRGRRPRAFRFRKRKPAS